MLMNLNPDISVILPTYNSALYISKSLESILNQTYSNFELLIYDDASTDNTLEIICSYNDSRIRIFTKEKNKGYTDSLISGINVAKGKYIARMDSDDISDIRRFEKQIRFLEENNEFGIVGSNMIAFKTESEQQFWKFPENDEEIKAFLIANSPFAHSAVMMRTSVLRANHINYDIAFEPCEDYLLWYNMLKYTKGKNLQETLLHYRMHEQQTISQRRELLLNTSNNIRNIIFNNLFNKSLSDSELKINYSFFNEIIPTDSSRIDKLFKWKITLETLIKSNSKAKYYNRLIQKYWILHLQTLREFRPGYFFFVFNKHLIKHAGFFFIVKLTIKSIIGYKVTE